MTQPTWSLGVDAADQWQRRALSEPFDRSKLSVIASGTTEHCAWELSDGPQHRTDDPDAFGSAFTLRMHGTTDFLLHLGEVGPALDAAEVARVGTSSNGVGADRHGFIQARCRSDVDTARVVFDDDSDAVITAVPSSTTGDHWVVCSLHSPSSPVRIEFLDHDGHVLHSQEVRDPRRRDNRP